ncbi:hypothetical protein GCM10027047_14520 [Rhodococcus aerolatus]
MTQGVDLDLDHLVAQLARHLERALIAARRAAQQRLAQQQAARRNAGQERARGAGSDRQTRELAAAHPMEALAARWAAADAVRDRDPVAARAWDDRVTDAGVDLDKVHHDSELPTEARDRSRSDVEAPGTGLDATAEAGTAVASDLVVEHLAEVYTDTALDPAPPAAAPTASDLVAAAHPGGPGGAPPTVAADATQAAEFATAQGVDQDQAHGLGADTGLDR